MSYITMATGEEQGAEHLPPHLLSSPHDSWEFNIFLDKLAQNIDDKELKRLKYFEYGSGGIRKKLFEEIKTTHEFFIYLQERNILSVDNLVHLQAMLWHLDRKDLVKYCAQFAETVPNTLYFHQPSPEPVNGYRHAAFHVEGKDLRNFKREDLEKLRNILSRRLGVPREFIIISGLTPSKSLVITVMIPEYNAELLVELLQGNRITELAELGIDSVLINDQTFIISEKSNVFVSKERNETAELVEKLEISQSLLEKCNIDLLRLRKKLQIPEERLRFTYATENSLIKVYGMERKGGEEQTPIALVVSPRVHKIRQKDHGIKFHDESMRIREIPSIVMSMRTPRGGLKEFTSRPLVVSPRVDKIRLKDHGIKFHDESMRKQTISSIPIGMGIPRAELQEVTSRDKSTREDENPK